MMNKQPIFIAALLLGLFAVLGTTLVAFTYTNTIDKIKDNERIALLNKLNQLVPSDLIDNDIVNDTKTISNLHYLGAESTKVYLGRKRGKAVAAVFVSIAPDGYNGKIKLLVAVMANGKLGGVRVIAHKETPGLGDKIDEKKDSWILQFPAMSLDNTLWKVKRDGGHFDQFTGATITPRAVIKAIKNTLLYYSKYGDQLFTKVKTT